MINIQNEMADSPEINQVLLKRAVRFTLNSIENSKGDITLRLTNDVEMNQLNQTFRNVDNTTDVLAFAQSFVDPDTNHLYLGDIIISVEQALRQASENGQTLDEECAFLAIHGTLHLLGFDHKTPKEKSEMWHHQEKIFNSLFLLAKETKNENPS